MVLWSFLHSIYNEEKIIHSPSWFGHIPGVIFPVWPIVVVWPKGNSSIAVLLNWYPLQQYSELPPLGNVCSPGCVNGLQPYVPLACLTPHLVWRWLAAPAPIPSLPSLSNSLHTQAIASASRRSPPPQQCTSPAFSLHQLPPCSHCSDGAVRVE